MNEGDDRRPRSPSPKRVQFEDDRSPFRNDRRSRYEDYRYDRPQSLGRLQGCGRGAYRGNNRGAVIVALAHSAVTNKTATMSLSTADSQRHAGDSEVGVVADRRTAISPWDDSRQADTRRVSNVVITDTHIPMIIQ